MEKKRKNKTTQKKEQPLKINGSFSDVIGLSVGKPAPQKKKEKKAK